jgi:hypothetical protein
MIIKLFDAKGTQVGNDSTFPDVRSAIGQAEDGYTVKMGAGSDSISDNPLGLNSFAPAPNQAVNLTIRGAGRSRTILTGGAYIYNYSNEAERLPVPTGMTVQGMTFSYTGRRSAEGFILQAGAFSAPPVPDRLDNLTLKDLAFMGKHKGQVDTDGIYNYLLGSNNFLAERISTKGLIGQAGYKSRTGKGGSAFLFFQFGQNIKIKESLFDTAGYGNGLTLNEVENYSIISNKFQGAGFFKGRGEVIARSQGSISKNVFNRGAFLDLITVDNKLNSINSNLFDATDSRGTRLNGGWGIAIRDLPLSDVRDNVTLSGNRFKNLIPVKSFISTAATGNSGTSPQLTFTGSGNSIFNPAVSKYQRFNRLIVGGLNADVLTGIGSSKQFRNFITGDLGNDSLTGGNGNDAFAFTTTADTSANKDVITNFNNTSQADKIWLDNHIFEPLPTGALGSAFGKYINYDRATGGLFYDDAGTGAFATRLADINPSARLKPNLSASDFVVF